MKYDSLKKQAVISFRVNNFDGGINLSDAPTTIKDNQLSECKNMWFKNGRLQTRPGFKGDIKNCYDTTILGHNGDLVYHITDTTFFIDEIPYKIAVGDVLTDDYAHYTYVYLVNKDKGLKSIGKMSFLRMSSDVFYTPINILFYVGKPQNGGGIFALVTLQNLRNFDDRYYYIYEVNSDFTDWERVYNYYIPTLYINGRGNKYNLAKSENNVSVPAPRTVESPNMLNGRFHAYFTSDGCSNSFRLPFTNLSSENVVCRIYYTLVDFVEWIVPSDSIANTQSFMGKKVTLEVDREKGTAYFKSEDGDYAVPVMSMYHENNIKITATKEIEKGFSRIVYSTCSVVTDSKIIISGGQNGNEIYIANYESPLYFPQGSAVNVGSGDSQINALSLQSSSILAFKAKEIYALNLKKGNKISEISLLADNDTLFNECDRFETQEITKQMGCVYKDTVALCNDSTIWLGEDNNIYALISIGSKKIINLSSRIKDIMPMYNDETFALSDGNYYFFVNRNEIIVIEKPEKENFKAYYWQMPDKFRISSGYYNNGEFGFLCVGESSNIVYLATLSDDTDSFMCYNEDGEIVDKPFEIQSSMKTKHYGLSGFSKSKNIDFIYMMLSSKGKTKISVNGKEIADINLRISDEGYSKGEYRSVKFVPHLYNADEVFITVESNHGLKVGEMEIFYRKIG